jgi:hypothetical protein
MLYGILASYPITWRLGLGHGLFRLIGMTIATI